MSGTTTNKFNSQTTNKIKQENLAANFCGLLAAQGITDSAIEWRILGQEQDGSLLASWISIGKTFNCENDVIQVDKSRIGLYNAQNKTFEILLTLNGRENIIQASINASKTLLTYVQKNHSDLGFVYQPYIIELKGYESSSELLPHALLQMARTKQVMVQFLWRKQSTFEKYYQDKFLVLIHEENILLFTCQLCKRDSLTDDPHNTNTMKIDFKLFDSWYLDKKTISNDIIVRNFTWAQWDANIQSLYFINVKDNTTTRGGGGGGTLLEKDEINNNKLFNPTLSAYQFHEDLPRETVLNIPLNLPKLPPSNSSNYIPIYEDDTVPLRIHDSSLNLMIVTDDVAGMLFVCHYYLYQPAMKQNVDDDDVDVDDVNKKKASGVGGGVPNNNDVHFAYSVTILHHGCVIHCVIPGITWDRAKLMKPTFKLQGDHHMIVYQPDLFVHLLDVGVQHEPCCHIISAAFNKQPTPTYLVPCSKWGSLCYDSATLDLISINIPKSHLIETFRQETSSIDNRLSIIHYFLVHGAGSSSSSSTAVDTNTIFSELMTIIMQNPLNGGGGGGGDTVPLIKETLIAGAYEMTRKNLSSELEMAPLIRLLPLTTVNSAKPIQVKIGPQLLSVGLSHEQLYNTTMMLLSPQQRLSPYRTDIWTRLWSHLNDNKEKIRFTLDQVTQKLILSLECYHPEALSKCTTPMSPMGIPQSSSSNFGDFFSSSTSRRNQMDSNFLPFIEFETCTATKQELIISVNLRELSLHLVKHTTKQNTSGFRWLKDTTNNITNAPTYVHTVASQFVAAQLELSRKICVHACRIGLGLGGGVAAAANNNHFDTLRDRGFHLIDSLTNYQQHNLYYTLERYLLASESMAFPLPQGFSSFFTYLGYRTLKFDMFMQYVNRYVFELQIDVVRAIFSDIDDATKDGVSKKIQLLSRLPRSRAKRLLHNWNHPYSLMIRGREHANSILSGNPLQQPINRRRKSGGGGAAGAGNVTAEQIKNKKLTINDDDGSTTTTTSKTGDRSKGLIAYPSDEKLSPLDTFLNLLTAKANLNELDFNLLIETVQSSLEDFSI